MIKCLSVVVFCFLISCDLSEKVTQTTVAEEMGRIKIGENVWLVKMLVHGDSYTDKVYFLVNDSGTVISGVGADYSSGKAHSTVSTIRWKDK
jgi:hypothetical protein